MQLALATLALSLFAVPDSSGPAPVISTRVHVLQMDGLAWRDQLHGTLHTVAQQGTVTVWTGGHFAVEALKKTAQSCLAAPRLVCQPDHPATVTWFDQRHLVTGMQRVADGPVFKASLLAFKPCIETVPDGVQLQLTGHPLDQGVLCRINLNESQVTHLHEVTLHDGVEKAAGEPGARQINASYQVPEIHITDIAGEWLVPTDGVLVFSLGARTVQDDENNDSQAGVIERLVLVETACIAAPQVPESTASGPVPLVSDVVAASITSQGRPVSLPFVSPHRVIPWPIGPIVNWMAPPVFDDVTVPVAEQLASYTAPSAPSEPAPVGVSCLGAACEPKASPAVAECSSTPPVPSRHVPLAFAADGTPVALPETASEAPLTQDPSGRPIGTPQARLPGATPYTSKPLSTLAQTDRVYEIEAQGPIRIRNGDQVIEANRLVVRVPQDAPTTFELSGAVVVHNLPAAAPADRQVRTVSTVPNTAPDSFEAQRVKIMVPSTVVPPVCPVTGEDACCASAEASACCEETQQVGVCPASGACSEEAAACSEEGAACCEEEGAACCEEEGAACCEAGAACCDEGAALSDEAAALSDEAAALSDEAAALSEEATPATCSEEAPAPGCPTDDEAPASVDAAVETTSLSGSPATTASTVKPARFSLSEASRLLKATADLAERFHVQPSLPKSGQIQFQFTIGLESNDEKP